MCAERLNRGKTLRVAYTSIYYKYFIPKGHRGPGGSVTNEDTSPGPVKTYLRDFGGAPGRI